MENLEFILYIIKRRSLFFIENSNDYFKYINGFIAGSKNGSLFDFFKEFEIYVIENNDLKGFENKPMHLIFNFLAVYENKSLDILNIELVNFLKSDRTDHLEIVTRFRESNKIEDLIEKYQD
ncbi:hypothetical protein DRF65_24100 [Chryseobacterium pennae]|uniref:Uncharacterized protein n=1 Tax=Chryseobacterium pennae TaxID=2258962 RepID=A0A3D9C1R8_9FLAO|nr:hypothetical protein [Chryseobacterium pennae]REC59813.1 hypothetical protein DRF65_24100 [Chryseobacterium pennae]